MDPARRTLATLLFLCVAVTVTADELDRYVLNQMRQLHLPGVGVVVLRNGTIVTKRAYGIANLELNVAVTDDTVFELGSVTKQFTAVAIMMLVEENKIRLDDSINKYLPQVPPAWDAITVRHLLTHSSGIQEYLSVPGLMEQAHAARTHDDLTKLLFDRLQLEFSPGETWSYSNSAYLLLGHILERVTGKSYWQFLSERIFTPLGMAATRSSEPRALISHRAAGYAWRGGKYQNRPALTENAYSAGAIVSTVGDMARWEAALYGQKLLSKASFHQMWTPLTVSRSPTPPFSYGFGWVVDQERGHTAVFHSGGTMGFSSAIRRYVGDGLAVIVLANGGDRILDHVALNIAAMFNPDVKRQQRADSDPARSELLARALRGLLSGKPETSLFGPAMQLFLTTAAGHGLWQWLGSHGDLKSLTYYQTDRVGANAVHRYAAVFGDAEMSVSFTISDDGKILQVYCW